MCDILLVSRDFTVELSSQLMISHLALEGHRDGPLGVRTPFRPWPPLTDPEICTCPSWGWLSFLSWQTERLGSSWSSALSLAVFIREAPRTPLYFLLSWILLFNSFLDFSMYVFLVKCVRYLCACGLKTTKNLQ